MSDGPLFKNADAQEAAYAPEGSDADRSGDDYTGDTVGDGDVPGAGVVLPAAGFATIGPGTGSVTGPTGSAAVGPAIAGAALAGDLPSEEGAREGDRAEGVNDAAGQTPSG
jgi:hypothetical protein